MEADAATKRTLEPIEMKITVTEYEELIKIATSITKGSSIEPLDLVHDALLLPKLPTKKSLVILFREQQRAEQKVSYRDMEHPFPPSKRKGEKFCTRCKHPYTPAKLKDIAWYCPSCRRAYNLERYYKKKASILPKQKKYRDSPHGRKLMNEAKKRYYYRNRKSILDKAARRREFNGFVAAL